MKIATNRLELAQASNALLSTTYSFEDGKNWNGTYITNGVVNVTNLTCYFHPGNLVCPEETKQGHEVTQGLAHAYGQQASSSSCVDYDDISDVLNSRRNPPYFCRRTPNRQEFAYRFLEYNPDDNQTMYPAFTNRVITASAGQCYNYSQVGKPSLVNDINGDRAAWNYTFTNGSFTSNIQIPVSAGAFMSTTYVYRGTQVPQRETTYRCGPRCISMWVHLNSNSGQGSSFFECPITVSNVSNATNHSVHAIPDDIALIAAASIGLQGRYSNHEKQTLWTQYQYYPFGY